MTLPTQVADAKKQNRPTTMLMAFVTELRDAVRVGGFADGTLFALTGLAILLGWGILSLTASVALTFEEEHTPAWQQSERLVLPVVR
ncbi:MAG: hypothetical protein RRB24_08510 [Armatimonadota bacterium]|nr:hypothetical protein [Armatimonadota bacterium]MDT7972854.1 hypothetical protein [Armatimonadota bacterium]